MERTNPCACIIIFALSSICITTVAHAQEAPKTVKLTQKQAKAVKDGKRQLVKKQFEKAEQLFNSALLEGEANIIHLLAGRTFQKQSKCEDAVISFGKVLKTPQVQKPAPKEIETTLKRFQTEMNKYCATLTINCDPETIAVKVNDKDIIDACETKNIIVSPGEHSVVGNLEEQTTQEKITLEVASQKTIDLKIVLPDLEPETLPLIPVPPPTKKTNIKAWALIGAGAGLLVASAVADGVTYNNYFSNSPSKDWAQDPNTLAVYAPIGGYTVGTGLGVWGLIELLTK